MDGKEWVVYAKPPFGGPEQVLKYLARYTHRVAISNSRLVALEEGRVTFRYKDYADDHKAKTMTLSAEEFLRRFMQHVLPQGFVKIRHYGLLANRCREQRLHECRRLLWPAAVATKTAGDAATRIEPAPRPCCPSCGSERIVRRARTRPPRPRRRPSRRRAIRRKPRRPAQVVASGAWAVAADRVRAVFRRAGKASPMKR